MAKRLAGIVLIVVLLLASCNFGEDEPPDPAQATDTPSAAQSESGSGDAASSVKSTSEPLPPATGTLVINRVGSQSGGAVQWQISGEVPFEIELNPSAGQSPSGAEVSGSIRTFTATTRLRVVRQSEDNDDEKEEEEEVIQASTFGFSASGPGSGSWTIAQPPCTGSGEFTIEYQIEGQLNLETGQIDMNLVENWLGGSSTATCAGVTNTEAIPPGTIPLTPLQINECENSTAQIENAWIQHPEALGGITWQDTFSVPDLSVPDRQDSDTVQINTDSVSGDDPIQGDGDTDQINTDSVSGDDPIQGDGDTDQINTDSVPGDDPTQGDDDTAQINSDSVSGDDPTQGDDDTDQIDSDSVPGNAPLKSACKP